MKSNRISGVRIVSGVLGALLLGLLLARGGFGVRAVPVEILVGGGAAALLACLAWSRRAAEVSEEKREEPAERGSSRSPRDVLREELGAEGAAERGGVQWSLRISPGRISVPGYVVVGILLQNAYDRPRIASVRLREGPGVTEGSAPSRVALKPGETGLLRIPIFLPADLKPGRRRFAADVSATSPEGEGERLVDRRGRADAEAGLEILGRHEGEPLNLWAFDWTGFRPIFATGQSRPDLEPVRLLDDLQQSPG